MVLGAYLIGSAVMLFGADSRPNVLMIGVDDLNDWIGCMKGHPQVQTPNIDRLAARGILFTNAHCAAPLCNPSRAALFSGRQPFHTGVLENDESNIRRVRPDLVLIPEHFRKAGYETLGTGKLLHHGSAGLFDEEFFPDLRWSPLTQKQVEYSKDELASKGSDNPIHRIVLGGRGISLPLNRMPSDRAPDKPGGESFDWGPFEVTDDGMGDGQIARWAANQLGKPHGKPFFLAIGFYRPHIPLFAPKKYFDLYDALSVQLPPTQQGDLDDLSDVAKAFALEPVTAGAHQTVQRYGQWQNAVKSYLACISFIDAQIGILLEALDQGPSADNTHIVFWSDHGWHLGEKEHWGKWTGWYRSTHVPCIIVPAKSSRLKASNAVCSQTIGLIDVYPTLIDLCELKPNAELAGDSLVPWIKNPELKTDRKVITTFGKGNYSIQDHRWHFIQYADGTRELYDRDQDPNEWTNLARRVEHAANVHQWQLELSRQLEH